MTTKVEVTDEEVERFCRAYEEPGNWISNGPKLCRDVARRALTALRTPEPQVVVTEEMAQVAQDTWEQHNQEEYRAFWTRIFRAMFAKMPEPEFTGEMRQAMDAASTGEGMFLAAWRVWRGQ